MPAPSALINYVLRQMVVTTNLCTRQKHEHGYKMQLRTIPDYNYIYVTRGKVIWCVAGEDHHLTPGELVIVPPGVPHYATGLTRRITLVSIHVEVRLPGGQDVFDLLMPPRRQSVPQGGRLDLYFRSACDEFDRPSTSEALIFLPGWAQLVTRELLRANAEAGLLRARSTDPLVGAMLEDLGRRIAEPVTLHDLARRSGFTPQHLNRLFRRVLGVTPLQYLARARMEHAATLLADGRLNIKAIAKKVGYDDPYYFSRMFTQHFGQSPAHYRKSTTAESPDLSMP
jgi:AraC-like DNA-binding protein